MLESLIIKNFAIIENTSLSFNLGFNVLIGETGAGKSIILDALKFVLGDKPNKDNIRTGQSEMSVKATFNNLSDVVNEKLKEFQIENDNILIISRNFNTEGKSSCLINGEPVTVGMLKQIGDILMDMYGQHQSIDLINTKNHLKMIDSYNPSLYEKEKSEIKSYLITLKEIKAKIDEIGGDYETRQREIDLLSYQINEIEKSNLQPNEDVELTNKILTLNNFEKILNSINQAYETISNSNLYQAVNNLSLASNYDASLNDFLERLTSAQIEVDDITVSLKEYLNNMDNGYEDIDTLNFRLDHIKNLKKKYGQTIEDILSYLDKSKQKLQVLQNSEEVLNDLTQKQNDIKTKLYDVCVNLHNKRQDISKEIETKIQNELTTLGMKNTVFSIKFEPLKDISECSFTESGIDNIEFLFSANAGETEKSLAKTISGGEMSRVMLAMKNVFNTSENMLLVFDEIDSGVSGEIGLKVGQKLASLSKKCQVLCITHLPQVTALADKFIFIKKEVQNSHTVSNAYYLNEEELEKYLATLFGSKTSEVAINHSKELIEMAKQYKLSLNK